MVEAVRCGAGMRAPTRDVLPLYVEDGRYREAFGALAGPCTDGGGGGGGGGGAHINIPSRPPTFMVIEGRGGCLSRCAGGADWLGKKVKRMYFWYD
jgi:hypothetical protein